MAPSNMRREVRLAGFGLHPRAQSSRMRARAQPPRPPLRRSFLHRRAHDAHLLPPGLSSPAGPGQERHILPDGRCRRSLRLPSLPALPTRDGPLLAGLAGITGNRASRRPLDPSRRTRRRGCRNAVRTTGDRLASSRSSLPQPYWREPAAGRPDDAHPESQAIARRNETADGRRRGPRRLLQPSPFQRRLRRSLRADADTDPADPFQASLTHEKGPTRVGPFRCSYAPTS